MPRPLPDPRHCGLLVAAVLPLTLTLTLTLAACGGGSGPPLPARAADLLEGALDIVAWPGYVERGTSDSRYDWVTPFEKDTGCKVNVRTAGTSDEMVSLMAQGGYDLVTASGDASLRLVRAGTVQPLNMARIPGYRTLDERLKEAPWHFIDGKHFGVPYQWGPNVLMYNTKVFRQAPSSWSVVFEAAKLAESLGCDGLRCERAEAVECVITRAREINDRPVVIDFVVGADAQVWPMVAAGMGNDEIQAAKGIRPLFDDSENEGHA